MTGVKFKKVKKVSKAGSARAKIEALEIAIRMLILEREDYATTLAKVLTCSSEEERQRAARYLYHVLGETGTTPSVYADPVLRSTAHQIWDITQERLKAAAHSKEGLICRALWCKPCGQFFVIASPLSVDAVSCPRCKELLKW